MCGRDFTLRIQNTYIASIRILPAIDYSEHILKWGHFKYDASFLLMYKSSSFGCAHKTRAIPRPPTYSLVLIVLAPANVRYMLTICWDVQAMGSKEWQPFFLIFSVFWPFACVSLAAESWISILRHMSNLLQGVSLGCTNKNKQALISGDGLSVIQIPWQGGWSCCNVLLKWERDNIYSGDSLLWYHSLL